MQSTLRRDASQRRRSGDLAMLILHTSVLQLPRRGTWIEAAATAQNDLGSVRTFLTDENGLVQGFRLIAALKLAKLDLDRKYRALRNLDKGRELSKICGRCIDAFKFQLLLPSRPG